MQTIHRLLVLVLCWVGLAGVVRAEPVELTLRSRTEFELIEKKAKWEAKETAVVVIDVWDLHWCAGANRRAGEMVGRMNALVGAMREMGATIVHAPSDTMKTYEQRPERALARSAPRSESAAAIKGWRYLDPKREGLLPIDDSDGGCDCEPQCRNYRAWTGQHAAIAIKEGDAISDNGQEIFNLLRQRGVKHVMILGVHTNMCILGRTFGIRQSVDNGFDVALVRDLTDTMYNPRKAPYVAHARGTELVIQHVERYWCPTILSSMVLGDARAERKPHVVLAINENEYKAKETLTAFTKEELEGKLGWKVTALVSEDAKSLPGTEALEDADLLIVYMRRNTLPEEQLARFRRYFEAGKPVIGLRTASHAFQNWLEFDAMVLGGNYKGHYGKDGGTKVTVAPGMESTALLRGVEPIPFASTSWLYKNPSLPAGTQVLLRGQFKNETLEPAAWVNVHRGGRVFYTSLGHPDDFEMPQFRRLLGNAIRWGMEGTDARP